MPKHEIGLSRLDELRLVRELKEVILEYLTTLHPTHTPNLALLIGRHASAVLSRPRDQRPGRDDEFIMIRGIAYLAPDKSKWKVVAESSKAQFGILPALQEFSKDLEREMGRMVEEGAGTGEKRGRERERSGLFAEEDGMAEMGSGKRWKGEDVRSGELERW